MSPSLVHRHGPVLSRRCRSSDPDWHYPTRVRSLRLHLALTQLFHGSLRRRIFREALSPDTRECSSRCGRNGLSLETSVPQSKFRRMPSRIDKAVKDGKLLPSAAKNIRALLDEARSDLYSRVVDELVAAQAWDELNDRFYKTLEFGTGGLRGRTIGKIVTKAERGNAGRDGRPEFPCVGTNAMNFANVNRATQGLVAYAKEWHAQNKITARPKIVIAHDTRFFSNEFTDLTAKVAAENGCDAYIFDGPRSTPELSFAVRHLTATAGIVITASHNPPHDNGYKVYFADGAQVIEPHASGIIAKVKAIKRESYEPLPQDRQGYVTALGKDVDEAYMKRLETLIVDPGVLNRTKALRIVFTPLHGTGAVTLEPMLKRLGF